MGVRIAIKGRAEPVPAELGETILAAALRAGLPYPHGCRSGNCGACKSELFEGEVELAPYSKYALADSERAAGLILACRAAAWSDCRVAPLDPEDSAVHPSRVLDCETVSIAAATHDIRILRLAIRGGGPFDYSPGQYAQVAFPGLPARDYSMATPPAGDTLEFHIRLVAGGAVTPFVLNDLRPGMRAKVSGPLGTAHYRARHKGPILALAGGSGLAPIKAIVEAALAGGASQPIRLYFGVRDERDLYLEEHFRGLAERHSNLRFVPVLSEPSAATRRRTGFLADAVAADLGDLDGWKAYLAGPPIMVETATATLRKKGLRRQDCHADAFYTEAEKAALEKKA